MSTLVDTNVLLAATDPARAEHRAALDFLQGGQDRAFTSPQVMREYVVVATRPSAANGLGLSMPDALANVEEFFQVVSLVFESEAAWDELRRLLRSQNPPMGKRVHDANVAATAVANGISRIATFNTADFAGFPVVAFEPGS